MTDKPAAPATPLTDAAAIAPSHRETALQYVPADFARRLETLCRQQHEALSLTNRRLIAGNPCWCSEGRPWGIHDSICNRASTALAAYDALERDIKHG